jgi:ATP-binding cassette, subfamily B, multidrug efflux pump
MARNRFFEDEIIERPFNKDQFKRLLGYVKPYRKTLGGTLVLMVITSLLSLAGPYLTKIIVDTMIPSEDVRGIVMIVSLYVIFVGIQIMLTIIRHKNMTRAGHNIIYDIRKDIFSNLQRLSFNYFDNRPTGKILVRITTYVDSLAGLLSDGIVNVIVDILSLFIIVGIMFTIDVRLTVISIVTFVPLILLIFFFHRAMRGKWRTVNNKSSNRTAYLHENIMGAKVTQAFVREEENQRIYSFLNNETKKAWLSAIKINNLFWPGVDGIGTIGVVLVYFIGYRFFASDMITVGSMIALAQYLGRFWAPLNNLSAIYNQLITAMANTERIFETIDEKPDITDADNARILPPIKGRVEFVDVDFGYDEKTKVLSNLSFKVEQGSSVALVGPTGAGKTTIVNLISRFYDTDSGAVLIDGYDVKDVMLRSLRRQMGIMMQESFIFAGTIMDNIRYGRPDATDEEVKNAAKAVYADEFISKLKNGYNTIVEEKGAGLSTGERQLLSFARTIIADPAILILDEATSSIDTKTEKLIQKALERLLEGRTSFIIAHRLSTIKKADRIMYVANRTITEEGSHDELMKRKGEYFELYRSQFSFINEAFIDICQ